MAIFENENLLAERHISEPRRHDALLAIIFQELLIKANIPINRLNAIAVSIGPGSFTGIRIGLSFALGLSFATGVDIIPIPTLDALAYKANKYAAPQLSNSIIIPIIDAGKLGYYFSEYLTMPNFMRSSGYSSLTEADFMNHLLNQANPNHNEIIVANSSKNSLSNLLAEELSSETIKIKFYNSQNVLAKDIGEYYWFAKDKFHALPPEKIEPMYIGSFG